MGWKRVEEEGGWIDGSLGYLATFSFLRQVRRGAGFFLPEVVEIRGDKKGAVCRESWRKGLRVGDQDGTRFSFCPCLE